MSDTFFAPDSARPAATAGDTPGATTADPAPHPHAGPPHPRSGPSRVVADDAGAVAAARELVGYLAEGADERDRERRLPAEEVRAIGRSGLLGATVPRPDGGADIGAVAVAEVMRLLGTADLSLAQILQPHFAFLKALRLRARPGAARRLHGAVLAGSLLSNAQAERSGRTAHTHATRLERLAGGGYRINGTKYYATGSLLADWLAVVAPAEVPGEPEPLPHIAYVERGARGVEVADDWDGMGQRTTASGTVRFTDVDVAEDLVIPHYLTFTRPTTYGAYAQLLHTAIDVGAARGALGRAGEFVRTSSRPWFEAGVEAAREDPLLVQRFGELEVQVRAAEALLATAAARVQEADALPTADATAEASIAVAAAKVAGGQAAVDTASALFELCGTRAAADSLNLHRHWRDARTHTVHDPARWKVHHIGQYSLNGRRPPRHGQL
ncbi:SfnB family sulfur acquisition oxidoreductase [Streptomonospora nanhaiensis]|uniref:Dibenzothiophene monooxygenase n=1 Tax=Streptomonospora nanhaiensis TaxID=1323731 RepID=A0A853BML2_9ACTN|nr:SfnB family sulfur acquisition oxidoreductase [Streptomonospora nanhaiensis]